MTVLVTGAGGFLGTVLVSRLLVRGGEPLRLFVRPGHGHQRLDALLERSGAEAEVVAGSLTNPEDCARAVAGVDTVYHLAAGTRGAAADRFSNSVVASKHLLDVTVAEDRPVKLVLVSSFAVYGVNALGRGALVDEATPLEPHPERRDVYAQAKLRQEQLFWEYRERHGLPLVVLRPGVVYGPGGPALSERVGLDVFGLFLHLGRGNTLPLNYVENCAEAIVVAGQHPDAVGQVYNTVDDDLPTCAEYLRAYQANVEPLRALRVPYPAALAMSAAVQKYHRWSKGQLPEAFTPYRTAALWGGNRFSNEKIKGIGYREVVSTREGMRRTFMGMTKGRTPARTAGSATSSRAGESGRKTRRRGEAPRDQPPEEPPERAASPDPGEAPVPQQGALGPLLRAIGAHRRLVVAVTALTVIACGAWLAVRSPSYEATAELLVSPLPQDDTTFIGVQVLRESTEPTRTMQTAATLISSRRAAQLTAARLGSGWDTQRVEDAVDVKPQGESSILAVTAHDRRPGEAERIANVYVAAALEQRHGDLRQQVKAAILQLGGRSVATRANDAAAVDTAQRLRQLRLVRDGVDPTFSLSQPAARPTAPIGPPSWLIGVLALLAGLTLATVAALLLESIAPRPPAPDRG